MKSTCRLKAHLFTAGSFLALAGATVFLIAPGKLDKKKRSSFIGRNFAHRGLHKIDKSIPENSIPAFDAAARIGYGVELDVHITSDNQLVVFHDDDLERVCGVKGHIRDMSYEELRQLRLFGTKNHIPLLSEVLAVINKRSPIIVELKRGIKRRELCRLTYEMMKSYGGRYFIESFDPRIVMWFRINAPEVIRGQLSTRPSVLRKTTSTINAFFLGYMLTNFLARPQFVAYELGHKPLTVKLCEMLGAIRVAWTSLEWSNEKKSDAVIFQFYRPMVKYK